MNQFKECNDISASERPSVKKFINPRPECTNTKRGKPKKLLPLHSVDHPGCLIAMTPSTYLLPNYNAFVCEWILESDWGIHYTSLKCSLFNRIVCFLKVILGTHYRIISAQFPSSTLLSKVPVCWWYFRFQSCGVGGMLSVFTDRGLTNRNRKY